MHRHTEYWHDVNFLLLLFPCQMNFLSEFCQNIYSYFKYHYIRQLHHFYYYVQNSNQFEKKTKWNSNINFKAKREIDIFFKCTQKKPTPTTKYIHSMPINVVFFCMIWNSWQRFGYIFSIIFCTILFRRIKYDNIMRCQSE